MGKEIVCNDCKKRAKGVTAMYNKFEKDLCWSCFNKRVERSIRGD